MVFDDIAQNVIDAVNTALGKDITYTPSVGSPVSIKGIFDNQFVDIEGIVSVKPTLRISLADLASAPTKNDAVTISSVTYSILESRVDGFGGTTLILQKQ